MRAEVISIGDELTSGQRLDTNSQWVSRELADLGIRVLFHTTVADDLQSNVEVFRRAVERVDIVIATGGLGPTADDLTREALATLAGVPLVLHEPSLNHIRMLFAQRTRSMPESNRIQAMFPQGSIPIPNPHGTAPGIEMPFAMPGHTAVVFALPGVPGEMKELWQDSVAPRLRTLVGTSKRIRHHVIKCFGVGESDLEQRLPDLIRRGRQPSVGITVSHATISLRITAEGADDAECQTQIEPTRQVIYDCLGDLIFGEGEFCELQHAVMRLLDASNLTLAICEWGTRGIIAQWLADASAASQHYLGAWEIGDREALQRLGIPIDPQMSTDRELVTELAKACRAAWKSDIALVVGPWPDEGSPGDRPLIHYALAADDVQLVHSTNTAGHPEIRVTRAAKQALNLLRLWLTQRSLPADSV